jgi:hypothetical protein
MKHSVLTLTPAAGKRLIGKGIAAAPVIQQVLKSGTLVIVAGTTNGYVAEEILAGLGQSKGFERKRFFRGITLPPHKIDAGLLPDESEFPGDVVIVNGVWQRGKQLFDVAGDLKEGDAILKGASAIDLARGQAALCIGHPNAGTIGVALQAVVGRRVRLILPVGLEKRIHSDINSLAKKINSPGVSGPRLFPVPGQIFTELDAIKTLTGATAELVAGGGVCGAEGSVWLIVGGEDAQHNAALNLLKSVASEPPFEL